MARRARSSVERSPRSRADSFTSKDTPGAGPASGAAKLRPMNPSTNSV